MKRCNHCNKLILRRFYPKDSDATFAARRSCTAKCRAEARRARESALPKTCPECGVVFTRGQDEPWIAWCQRRYCCPECTQAVNRRRSVERKKRAPKRRVKGVAYQRLLQNQIAAQVGWVFEVSGGVFVRSELIRAIRSAGDDYAAELILEAAIPGKYGKLFEGTRRRVMERVKSLRVAS